MIKISVLFGFSRYMFIRWNNQEKKYYTDFPFLTVLATLFFGIAKIYDILLYSLFKNTPNIASLPNEALPMTKIRFILCPLIAILPYLILLFIIWFEGKRKVQFIFGISWFLASLIAILTAKNYNQLLSLITFVMLPPIVLSIITYFVLYSKHRFPQINSLMIGIGWILFSITQLIRPIWIDIKLNSNSTWGLSWLGEIVELLSFSLIVIGLIIPSSYAKNNENSRNNVKPFVNGNKEQFGEQETIIENE